MSVKLSRANALLFKTRNLINSSILRTIYFSIFESNLNYCSFEWSQNCNVINRLVVLQKKALRIINFSHVTLTIILCSKKVLFCNSQIKLIQKTHYLSVNPSIIFYLLFSMTGSYFHLTNTIMKLLGLPLAIFTSLLAKLSAIFF